MSQSVAPQTMSARGESVSFQYRPVPVTAPVSLCLGICSFLALVGPFGIGISLLGVAIAWRCLSQIRRSDGELGGKWLATLGLWTSAAFLVGGSSLQAYQYQMELPAGFRRVNFAQEISKPQFVIDRNGNQQIAPEVRALASQKIFLKGYMYPTRDTEGLTEFILVKDNQQCCFGGQPALTDMIHVRLQGGARLDYTDRLVSVAGVFQIVEAPPSGPLSPIYALDATHAVRSASLF
jgi:hypothetical protein